MSRMNQYEKFHEFENNENEIQMLNIRMTS